MEEKKINEKESIEIITSMIVRTRQRLMLGDGNIILMWGYLTVCVAALVWWLLVTIRHPAVNWLWFAIWIIGGIATPVMARKRQAEKGVKSYSDKVSSAIWSVVGYSAIASTSFCLGFLLFGGIDCWAMMFALALVIVPFGEIAQGIIIRERPFVWGGAAGLAVGIFTLCCIAGGIALHADWYLPLFMLAFVCMMIVPGHILNHKARKQQ